MCHHLELGPKENPILILLPLTTTTYLCELGSFTINQWLITTPERRVVLSSCLPNWHQLLANKQAHPSSKRKYCSPCPFLLECHAKCVLLNVAIFILKIEICNLI